MPLDGFLLTDLISRSISDLPWMVSTKAWIAWALRSDRRLRFNRKNSQKCENSSQDVDKRSKWTPSDVLWEVSQEPSALKAADKWIKQECARIDLKRFKFHGNLHEKVKSAKPKMIRKDCATACSHHSLIDIIVASLTNGFLKFLTRFSGKRRCALHNPSIDDENPNLDKKISSSHCSPGHEQLWLCGTNLIV